jgi:O-antigen/teichoic acid export membrane protein
MISKQFLKSSLVYTIIGALPYISGIILIPFFTNSLTTEQFGANALYFSFLYLIQIVSTFALDFYIGISYFEFKDNPQRFKQMIGTVLISLSFVGGLVLIVFLLLGKQIFHVVFHEAPSVFFYPFGFFTVLTAIFNGFIKTYSNLLINQQRPKRFFWINLMNFILVVTFSLLLLHFFPFTLYGPILGRLFPSVISFLLVSFFMIKEFGFTYDLKLIKQIRNFCIPLLVYSFSIWIVNYIDRFFINGFLNETIVGIYDTAVKLTLILDILQIGLNSAIQPKVFLIWQKTKKPGSNPEVNRYYNVMTGITLILIPLFVLVIPLLVPLVITKKIYYQAFAFLPLLSLGFASRVWFYLFIAPIFYFKHTKVLPRVFFISAIIQAIMTYFLIKYFSLMGAVYANFLIKPVQALLLYRESRKIFNYHFNRWKIVYLPIIFMCTVLLLSGIFRNSSPLLVGSFELLVSAGMVSFLYRKEISGLLKNRLSSSSS